MRIPFGTLIERGLIKAGETLFDHATRIAANVRADGSIAAKNTSGSIHKVGATVQNAEACNGWTYWHVRRGPNLVPIDVLRQQVRAEMGTASSPHSRHPHERSSFNHAMRTLDCGLGVAGLHDPRLSSRRHTVSLAL